MTVPDVPRILVGPSVTRSDEAREREVETLPPARTSKSHLERANPPDTVETLPACGVALSKAPRKNRRCNEKMVDGRVNAL